MLWGATGLQAVGDGDFWVDILTMKWLQWEPGRLLSGCSARSAEQSGAHDKVQVGDTVYGQEGPGFIARCEWLMSVVRGAGCRA